MNRSITEKKKKHLKACTQRPNASFDPKALVSVASSSPTVSTAVWVGCERERRSLLMSTLGESALLFCWVLFWKILQPRDRGGKLTQAVRKNLSIWVNCSGRGSLVIIIRDGFFCFNVSTYVPVVIWDEGDFYFFAHFLYFTEAMIIRMQFGGKFRSGSARPGHLNFCLGSVAHNYTPDC